jgi:cellulose biosynthesis protein BcsQ
MYDKNNTAAKVVFSKLKNRYKEKMFTTVIDFDFKMQESQILNEPIVYYDEKAVSALQYKALVKEVEEA